jgi:hypothetical protein
VTVSVAALARQGSTHAAVRLPTVYAGALAFWLVTRWLVLVHQGAWPWMNSFVVDAARGIIVGDWVDAVRPQLPAVLDIPLVVAGATEQQTVAGLYLLASLAQFAAFVVLVRAIWPRLVLEQTLALLVLLLIPFDHSIHHYRDTPVLLASSAIFLLCAHFIRTLGSRGLAAPLTWKTIALVVAAMFFAVWCRLEVLTLVGVLVLAAAVVWRKLALPLAATYIVAALLAAGTLFATYQLAGVNVAQASFYTAHTFLDSTPDSWLSPECQANPTENCRETDGLTYFGPADPHQGVFVLAMDHPLTTVAKSVRSAWDNLWILFGPNLSTFPGIIPFVLIGVAVLEPARAMYRELPLPVWIAAAAVFAESVLPPLTWAPPHPQYHVQLVFPVAVLLVPILVALWRTPRGRLIAVAVLVANVGLSAFRYTRYPGY